MEGASLYESVWFDRSGLRVGFRPRGASRAQRRGRNLALAYAADGQSRRSGFGATPPVTPQHERLWASLEREASWLALKFIRAEMDWRQWQPSRGVFTWDSAEMRILDRILGWAQRQGSDVMLQCMWRNVELLAFGEYRADPALVRVSAPADLEGSRSRLHRSADHRRSRGRALVAAHG